MSVYYLYETVEIYASVEENNFYKDKIIVDKIPFICTRYKGLVANLFWKLLDRKCYVCAIVGEENVIKHYSYVMRKSPKFPFMRKNDYMIGPSVTMENYRGQGLFPRVIRFVINKIKTEGPDVRLVALVREDNYASRSAFEKVGMQWLGKRFVKNKYKVYYEIKDLQ